MSGFPGISSGVVTRPGWTMKQKKVKQIVGNKNKGRVHLIPFHLVPQQLFTD